ADPVATAGGSVVVLKVVEKNSAGAGSTPAARVQVRVGLRRSREHELLESILESAYKKTEPQINEEYIRQFGPRWPSGRARPRVGACVLPPAPRPDGSSWAACDPLPRSLELPQRRAGPDAPQGPEPRLLTPPLSPLSPSHGSSRLLARPESLRGVHPDL